MRGLDRTWLRCALAGSGALWVLSAGCGGRGAQDSSPADLLAIDGSSTVYPIVEAVAEVLLERGLETRITVGISGTGGGFKRLCAGETTIAAASRPIRASEVAQCAANHVPFVELPIAWDGVAVVVNPQNTWVKALTVAQLRALWAPAGQGTPTTWRQLDPTWPDDPIHLFGAGVDSGTYDYFTKAIVGAEHSSRGDFTSSEDDNVLVQGVSADRDALAFMGMTYYAQNPDRMRLVAIDDQDPRNGDGPILPTVATVTNATYQPLTRPVFLYVRADHAARPDVQAFVRLLLGERGAGLIEEVGQVPIAGGLRPTVLDRYETRVVGSAFEGGSEVGADLATLLRAPERPAVAPTPPSAP